MSAKRTASSALGAVLSSPADQKKLKQGSLSSFFSGGVNGLRKSSATTAIVPKFDKQAWVKGLNDAQRDLLRLEIETLHESWLAVLKDELTKPYFLNLKDFIRKERLAQTVFPPENEVYSWSQHTPFDRVKVVILGQDPYHNYGQAHGLCFSVRPPTPAPSSLKNIFKTIKIDYPTFTEPNNGLLTPWADRGVLLLNTSLTVRCHQANSHSNKGWETFTAAALASLLKSSRGVVVLAWGSSAKSRIDSLRVDKTRHCVLRTVHPSGLSASRGFFECGHFRKANEWLRERYGIEGEVEWDCLAEGKGKKGLKIQDAKNSTDAVPNGTNGTGLKEDVNTLADTEIKESPNGVTEGSPTKLPLIAEQNGHDGVEVEDPLEFEVEELAKLP